MFRAIENDEAIKSNKLPYSLNPILQSNVTNESLILNLNKNNSISIKRNLLNDFENDKISCESNIHIEIASSIQSPNN